MLKILIAEDDRELRQLREVGNTTPVLMITAKDAFDDMRLGLALVKRILTLENGQIQAKNLSEGGCRFTVTLRTT